MKIDLKKIAKLHLHPGDILVVDPHEFSIEDAQQIHRYANCKVILAPIDSVGVLRFKDRDKLKSVENIK